MFANSNILKEIVNKLKTFSHTPPTNPDDWDRVHPNLLIVAEYVVDHCETHKLPLVFTSIIRPKIKGVSKTDIHAKGRAFDISVKGWSKEDMGFLVDIINEEMTIGAISITDGKEREAVWEDGVSAGTGPHLHFQVRA